jgi:AcrR family transcriptional regulator
MATAAAKAPDSRQRFIEAAVRLFARHSFAGTSLQMIADEVGVTKSAVHHHFRTREELMTAVIEPLHEDLRVEVEAAEALRGRHARAERMLNGFVDLVVRYRTLVPLLAGDPGTVETLRTNATMSDLVERHIKLFADLEPGPGGYIKANVTLAGIACGLSPRVDELDDATLRRHLVDAGRRTLGLRTRRCVL